MKRLAAGLVVCAAAIAAQAKTSAPVERPEGDDEELVADDAFSNDGHWHGIEYAESWAACVQTNAALPTAWKYFTEQFRPYVRRQLLPKDETAFAKETAALVDGVARSLWTPFVDRVKSSALREDYKVAQSLRDRGCSNLTVLAFAKIADRADHKDRFCSMSRKQRAPYREFATNLVVNGASPLLRLLQPLVEKMGELTPAEKRLVYKRMASLGVSEPVATGDISRRPLNERGNFFPK